LPALIQDRAGNGSTVDRVWPVEYNESNVVFGSSLHGLAQGRNIGIKPGTNILDVEDQRIYSAQHVAGRPTGAAVQTENPDPGCVIFTVINKRDVKLAENSVFGTKQRNEIYLPGIMEKLNGATASAVKPRLVCYQPDIPAGELLEPVSPQDIDATQDNACIGRLWPCLSGVRNSGRNAYGGGNCYQQGENQQASEPAALWYLTHIVHFQPEYIQFERGSTHYTDKYHGKPH